MKRILPLLLALVLLMGLLPARAETFPDTIYRIVLRTETEDITLGTGVLFGSKTTLLTVRACYAEGNLVAIGADGEHAVSYRGEVAGSQLITLGLATESAAEPISVTEADYLMDYNVYGVKADGTLVASPVQQTRLTYFSNHGEVILYADEGLLPGAMMFGDDEGLALITVWQETEGLGAYAAVSDVSLNRIFREENTLPSGKLVRNFTAEWDRGEILVDWSQGTGFIPTEDTVFTVYSTATCNTYLTSITATAEETSVRLPAIPGTETVVWIGVSQGEPAEAVFPESGMDMVMVATGTPEPFTLNGLTNLRFGITAAAPGQDAMPADFLPQVPLTRETLSDRSLSMYFQTEDTYTATAEDDDHTLMVTLYTPEGYAFYYYSGYIFMPEFCESDLWVSDITDLFTDYERFAEEEPWPAGDYTVLYTIDGGEVAQFTFTLE